VSLRALHVLALLAALSSTASQAASTAVAVMPFKNVTGTAELDWLKLGMAETLLADLAKDGGRPVVERDQLDRALAEVLLQTENASDDTLAARAGKLVGAATVVLGGFQAAQGELRITARFVDVESGVVKETAKATGPLADVFALQDQIAAKLLQKPPKKPRPKAKAPAKQLEAYQLYALSLSTTSQAEQVRYLKDSVAADPDFVYALDALKTLEKKIVEFRKSRAERDRLAGDAAVLAARSREGTTSERQLRIMNAFAALLTARRYSALLALATEIYDERLPPEQYWNVHEQASEYRFYALRMLRRLDDALRAGERHIDEFPEGRSTQSVASQLEAIIQQKAGIAERRAGLPAALKAIDDAAARPHADPAMIGYRRCAAHRTAEEHALAIDLCGAWAREHAGRADKLDRAALVLVMLSLADLGRFDDARAAAAALTATDAAWAKEHLGSIVDGWPR
jgi:TolB-like protein